MPHFGEWCPRGWHVPEHQPDVDINQANPGSGVWYEVLPITSNVRIISIAAKITGAATTFDWLEAVVSIDAQALIFRVAPPVSGTQYFASLASEMTNMLQVLETTDRCAQGKAFLVEGRKIGVSAAVKWSIAQPTPLVCRVKYAKW